MRARRVAVLYSTGGRPAGCVVWFDGQTLLWKRAAVAQHQLRKPPAWAWDVQVLRDAEELGATVGWIQSTDTGQDFTAPLEAFRTLGFDVNRGHGQQRGLELRFWHVENQAQLPLLEVGA